MGGLGKVSKGRSLSTMVGICVVAVLVAAPARYPLVAAPAPRLIVGVSATPVSLDPEFSTTLESWELPIAVYEYLVSYKFQKNAQGIGIPQFGSLEPRLAESWAFSQGGKRITFHLRKGVKSEYGNEFAAEDVRWSWARAFGLNTSGTWLLKVSAVPNAEAINVVDKYTLEVNLSGPNGLLLSTEATPLNSPVIYDSTEAKKHATQADPWAKEWLGTHSATFGPYRVSKFTPGQELILETNPNYYREKPQIARVVFREIPSSATRLQLLIAGSIDIARELDARERQTLRGKAGVKVLSVRGNDGVIFGLNNKVKPLDNVKVRQAIAYAAPIDDIIRTVYLSDPNVRLLKGYVPETYPAYTGYWPYYPTNLDKARALLKEAGQGPFSFKLAFNAGRPEHERVGVFLRTQLKKLGIDLVLDKLTPAKYQEQYFSRKAEAVLVQDSAWVADPAYPVNLYFGAGTNSVANWINYDNKEVQKLLERLLNIPEFDERKQLAQKVHNMIVNEAPWGFYIGTGFYLAVRDRVTGLNWRSNNLVNYAELSLK